MAAAGSTITIRVPEGVSIYHGRCAVTGIFLLAPNRWDGQARVLHRPLRGRRDRLIHTVIRQRFSRSSPHQPVTAG